MRNISSAFKSALENDNRAYLEYVDVVLENNTQLHLTNADLWQNGFKIEDSVSPNGDFQVGSAVVNKATLIINNIYGDFDSYDFFGADITLSIALVINEAQEIIPIGKYKVVEQPKYNGSLITVEAYDYMYKFDKPYSESNLAYPASLDTIVRDACTNCGVTLITTDFPNKDFVVEERPDDEKLTFREVIAYAAQICCCYARCNQNGYLALSWYNQDALNTAKAQDGVTGVHYLDSMYSKNFSIVDVLITGVKASKTVERETIDEGSTYTRTYYETADYLYGTEGYVISIEENPLVTENQLPTVATYVGQKLVGFAFRTAEVSHGSNPSIEAGDVAVCIDGKGNRYPIIISSTTFSVGSPQSIQSEATEPIRQSATRYSENTKNFVALRNLIAEEKTDRERMQEDINGRIEAANGLYETNVEDVQGAIITYLHNKTDLESSDIRIKVSDVGVMVTANGTAAQPTWYGLTVDGQMITNILDTVGINADWINTGQLVISRNGTEVFFADVDTGTVRISGNAISIVAGDALDTAIGTKSGTVTRTILDNAQAYGLGCKINYSGFNTASNSSCYYHGYSTVGQASDANGWVQWNGEKVTIPRGRNINLGSTMPFGTTIYSVFRKSNSSWHDVAWIESSNTWEANTYSGSTPSARTTWTWDEANDIILLSYSVASAGAAITDAKLFTPPKKFSELAEVASMKAKLYTDSTLSTFATTINAEIADIEAQLDGVIDTYYYSYKPTLSNEPASTWTTDADKENHIGDLFYDTSTGKVYRFVTDSANLVAYPFYHTTRTNDGITWTDNGDGTVTANGTATTTTSFAIRSRLNSSFSLQEGIYHLSGCPSGGSSSKYCVYVIYTLNGAASTIASDYGDGADFTLAENTIEVGVQCRVNNGQTVSDLVFEPKLILKYGWIEIPDTDAQQALQLASEAKDTADQKRRVFIAQPTTPYDIGDLWMQGASGDIMTCTNSRDTGNFISTDWLKLNKYTDDTATAALALRVTDLETETVAYYMNVSQAAVVKGIDGTYNPASITVSAKAQQIGEALTDYSGRFKIETQTGSTWTARYTSSSNESSKTYTIPSDIVAIRCSLYKAGGTTDLLDQQIIPIVSDGADGQDGQDGQPGQRGQAGEAGEDAYTVVLTNESHTFVGSETAALAGNTTCGVITYKGATQISCYVGASSSATTISTGFTGLTCSIANNNSTNVTLTFTATTSLTTKNGTVTIPVHVDGKTFNQVFSFSLALKGEEGERGATWYAGTKITGTSTTATVFSNSGVTDAKVGDHYLNTSTQNVYICTLGGVASIAKWKYEQNIKGTDGVQGAAGADGVSAYLHVKYSNDGGQTFTGNSGEDAGDWIGTYTDSIQTDSSSVSSYTWAKIKGEDGQDGQDGEDGEDAYFLETPFSWVANGTRAEFEAIIYKGEENVTDYYPEAWFEWYLRNEDGENRIAIGKTCSVAKSNLGYGSTITCIFTTQENRNARLLVRSGAKLMTRSGLDLTTYSDSDGDQRVTELPVKTSDEILADDTIMGIDAADGYQTTVGDLADFIYNNDFPTQNLMIYPYSDTTTVREGITYVDEEDGSITITGTATANATYYFKGRTDRFMLPAGNYYINQPPDASGSTCRFRIDGYKLGQYVKSYVSGAANRIAIFSNDDIDSLECVFIVYPDYTLNSINFTPEIYREIPTTSLATALGDRIYRYGDTMEEKALTLMSYNISDSVPQATQGGQCYLNFTNLDRHQSGWVQSKMTADGYCTLDLYARYPNTTRYAYVRMGVTEDGTQWVGVSNATAWRTALNAVNKSGDTLTGTVAIRNNDITLGTVPSSNYYGKAVVFEDSAGTDFGIVRGNYYNTGDAAIQIFSQRVVSGTTRTNAITLRVDPDGNAAVAISGTGAAASWRSAIGAVNIAGDTMTGNLAISKATPLIYYQGTISMRRGAAALSANTACGQLQHRDSNGQTIFYSESFRTTDNITYTSFVHRRYDSSGANPVTNGFYLRIDNAGNPVVAFTTAAARSAWMSALQALPTTGGSVTGQVFYDRADVDCSKADNGISSAIYATMCAIRDKENRVFGRLEYVPYPSGNTQAYWYVRNYNTSGAQVAQKGISMTMNKSGTLTYGVSDSANFRSAIGAAAASSSALRYKHDVKELEDEKLDAHRLYDLKAKQFVFNDDFENLQYEDMKGQTIAGFIAEDINEIYPSAVIHKDGEIESWDERRIIPAMLKLIQEQHDEIEKLKSVIHIS